MSRMHQAKKKNHIPQIGNIFLVGMMGAGKTTVGKALAEYMGMQFIDSDHEIQSRTGVKIPTIFEIEGEAGFRKRERNVIRDLVKQPNIILATGGGAILNHENRELLQKHGTVIYLRTNVHDLYQRTRHDKNRPLLQNTNNVEAKLTSLYEERDPLYQQAAHLIIDSGKQNVRHLVRKIILNLTSSTPPIRHKTTMQTISVNFKSSLRQNSYPIYIDQNILENTELITSHLSQKRVAIVSNTTVAPLYLDKLTTTLKQHGINSIPIIIPDGEKYKNWETLNFIYDALLEHRCERNTAILALGGGVVGDLTGFAAATYLRGVPFIQIPTTLLAQVDSSVGGKTGINHPLGKNMLGAFYQPQMVLADITTLNTLPDREFRAGIAEIIKYGLIRDAAFFEWLEQNIAQLVARDPQVMNEAIRRSCENKAEIVAADEKEKGVRALLNLGHTFAHAIENGMGYGAWLHGEAVAAGTILATEVSHRLKFISDTDVKRIRNIFEQTGLPIYAPKLSPEKYLQLMALDKKVESGVIRFVLLTSIGEAAVYANIPTKIVSEVITEFAIQE